MKVVLAGAYGNLGAAFRTLSPTQKSSLYLFVQHDTSL